MYFPATQGKHILADDAPRMSEYVPTSQARHTAAVVAPEIVEKVPVGQYKQERTDCASNEIE